MSGNSRIIQVTNVAPQATQEQMKTLFSFLGRIEEVELFPHNDMIPVNSKICFVKYEDSASVGVALHLTNAVFIDRALIVVPSAEAQIPDEMSAMKLAAPPNTVAGMTPTKASWPINVISQVTGTGSSQQIQTVDPRLASLGLPAYPSLPATLDPAKVDEIRCTVYVTNFDITVTAAQMLQFFSQVGEVKYVRMAKHMTDFSCGCAYVEFSEQPSVALALGQNGISYNGRVLGVQHATSSIVKPAQIKHAASLREMEDAMRKVKEAQSLISAAADPELKKLRRSRSRSRSKTYRRGKSRSRSRSRIHSSRSRRSRSRRRSTSRSYTKSLRSRKVSPHRRSKSPRRKSKSPRRKSKSPRQKSKSPPRKSKSPRRKSKSPPRKSKSPRRKSKSPRRKSKSPRRRSKSPPPKRSGRRRSLSRSKSRERRRKDDKSRRSGRTRSRTPKSYRLSRKSRSRSRSPNKSPTKTATAATKSCSKSPEPVAKKSSVSPAKDVGATNHDADKDELSRKEADKDRSSGDKSKDADRYRDKDESKSRSHRRSRSPRRSPRRVRKRSRSPRRSRTRSPRRPRRRERSPDRNRDRDRSRDRVGSRGEHHSSTGGGGGKGDNKVTRDYDEEEKGYGSDDKPSGDTRGAGGKMETGSADERKVASPPPLPPLPMESDRVDGCGKEEGHVSKDSDMDVDSD